MFEWALVLLDFCQNCPIFKHLTILPKIYHGQIDSIQCEWNDFFEKLFRKLREIFEAHPHVFVYIEPEMFQCSINK